MRYTGPDGERHKAPAPFDSLGDAEAYLLEVRQQIYLGLWVAPVKTDARRADPTNIPEPTLPTFAEYAEACITARENRPRKPLRPSTAAMYRKVLRLELAEPFGDKPLDKITAAEIRRWHVEASKRGKPTQLANAYGFLRSVFADAIREDELITINPARVRGAGKPERERQGVALTKDELAAYVRAVPERYRVALALCGWCALRSGEVRALRVGDYDRDTGELRVERAVVRIDGRTIVDKPKTKAGMRVVFVPPHVRAMVTDWINDQPVRGRDALLFPATDGVSALHSSTLNGAHRKAAEAIGRPEMVIHDLRRTALTLAGRDGATHAELKVMAGHTTLTVVDLYQQADRHRMREILERMSKTV